jgi:small conductance mechanosensitive channel
MGCMCKFAITGKEHLMFRRRPLPRPSRNVRRPSYFETRTDEWRQVGLSAEIDQAQAQRARGGVVVVALLIAGVLVLFSKRQELFPGLDTEVRIATVAALVILGWALARMIGRGVAPALFRRMDPGTAGTVGFLIRLATIAIVVVVALRVAGLNASTLAVGGAFTAVVLGLAAQQTISNLFAGIVLQSTRPFRVGERVRLIGGALAGQVEGIVASLGLFYTSLVSGADRIMVPNAVVLQLAVVPLREPERVELRARFSADITPGEVQEMIADSLTVPTRHPPHIALEELERDEVVVRIMATPRDPADGGKLAAEVLTAVRERDGARPEAAPGDGR